MKNVRFKKIRGTVDSYLIGILGSLAWMPIPTRWSQDLSKLVKSWKSGKYYELGTAHFDKFVVTDRADSWEHFMAWLVELQGSWCFRGQRDAKWDLDTSLDRAVKKEEDGGYYHLNRKQEANNLLFRFQQQAHQYIDQAPSSQDVSSWFALMQHHSVPTMFLDWTSSAYVAMYFALEEEAPKYGSAIWAIDLEWLDRTSRELLPAGEQRRDLHASAPTLDDFIQEAEYLNSLLRHTKMAVILRVHPRRLDARMVAQQGFFLCKLYDEAAFSLVLMRMMMKPITLETPDRPVVRKLVLNKKLRISCLKNLRAMNIHRASLFPGLDGFGRSLKFDLEIKVKG